MTDREDARRCSKQDLIAIQHRGIGTQTQHKVKPTNNTHSKPIYKIGLLLRARPLLKVLTWRVEGLLLADLEGRLLRMRPELSQEAAAPPKSHATGCQCQGLRNQTPAAPVSSTKLPMRPSSTVATQQIPSSALSIFDQGPGRAPRHMLSSASLLSHTPSLLFVMWCVLWATLLMTPLNVGTATRKIGCGSAHCLQNDACHACW